MGQATPSSLTVSVSPRRDQRDDSTDVSGLGLEARECIPEKMLLTQKQSLASQRSTKTKVWDTAIMNGAVSPMKTHVKVPPWYLKVENKIVQTQQLKMRFVVSALFLSSKKQKRRMRHYNGDSLGWEHCCHQPKNASGRQQTAIYKKRCQLSLVHPLIPQTQTPGFGIDGLGRCYVVIRSC